MGPYTIVGWLVWDRKPNEMAQHTRKFPLVFIFFLLSQNTEAVRYRSKNYIL